MGLLVNFTNINGILLEKILSLCEGDFCLNINEGGMGMINIDNFVKSKQIQFIYKIINSEMDSWNAIGKHWLQKYDSKFGVDYFLCKCSDIKGLDIASIP